MDQSETRSSGSHLTLVYRPNQKPASVVIYDFQVIGTNQTRLFGSYLTVRSIDPTRDLLMWPFTTSRSWGPIRDSTLRSIDLTLDLLVWLDGGLNPTPNATRSSKSLLLGVC